MQGADSDLMDGETEADTVVIAGQPEVLSTQAMQVQNTTIGHTRFTAYRVPALAVVAQCLLAEWICFVSSCNYLLPLCVLRIGGE